MTRDTGERVERDELVEDLLTELTGAEAATVVNNNAAATLLVLAALAAGKEVIVSRGQLIEIGGSFRLPEVMAQSGARLVEVGATNRTHLKDYQRAITPETAAILRVHPSNYRVVGFTSELELRELAELAHSRDLLLMDDLGAGALVGPGAVRPAARADGAGVDRGRRRPGAVQRRQADRGQARRDHRRAQAPDRPAAQAPADAGRARGQNLPDGARAHAALFRDPERLRREHPTYRMICTPLETLRPARQALARRALDGCARRCRPRLTPEHCLSRQRLLADRSDPEHRRERVAIPGLSAAELARRLRLDEACVFGRIEDDRVRLDLRTITDEQVPAIAAALGGSRGRRPMSSIRAEHHARHRRARGPRQDRAGQAADRLRNRHAGRGESSAG